MPEKPAATVRFGTSGFHVLCKPVGPACNLACRYCFYLEKGETLGRGARPMEDPLLERFIAEYIQVHELMGSPEVPFGWQGGEPLLAGVEFFERVVELQRIHGRGRPIRNAIQTNGTLIDARWCELFARHGFLVGLSLDGPQALHDLHRVDRAGRGSFARVLRASELLRAHAVDTNLLVVVSRDNASQPLELYDFCRRVGSGHLQFIPLVERIDPARGAGAEPSFLAPPSPGSAPSEGLASPESVDAARWGEFLVRVFDAWLREDIGRCYIQIFESALAHHAGLASSLCVYAEECGAALVLERDGSLYSCDHYVYPEHLLGRIGEQSLLEMARSPQQRRFGEAKRLGLSSTCQSCDLLHLCHGDCPKHRFLVDAEGEPGRSWLCEGYKHFFEHSALWFQRMARLLMAGRRPAELMRHPSLAAPERWPGRNEPCPCGSGRKFRSCCGREPVTPGVLLADSGGSGR